MTNTGTGKPSQDELSSLQGFLPSPSGGRALSFSDDIEALDAVVEETRQRQLANQVPVPHKIWSTKDIFRSEPDIHASSQELVMPTMTSSPPPSPSSQKRKFADLDLGINTLERAPKTIKAQRSYYGINIHALLEEAQAEEKIAKVQREALEGRVSRAPQQVPTPPAEREAKRTLLWTEKYRARKFTELIGDERTHRAVMHWLKRWDQIVFPGSWKPKHKAKRFGEQGDEERSHRKILMLTGPPGLGKTTLAHVCARQAGYEVQEINASDERGRDVVKGRIRDMVGTDNVRSVDTRQINGKTHKAGKPVCVIVDEVDGVVSGSAGAGGEGGFIKALIDLVLLDQKNSAALATLQQAPASKRKGDRFRLLRPMILVCNDAYHPSLRPLRQSQHAEVIHMRKPAMENVASRMYTIFEREGIPADTDGIRRMCEAAWGVSSRKEDRAGSGAGEGDMRGVMVVGEWVAGKLRALKGSHCETRLTRKWFEDNILKDLQHGGGGARGLGRGSPRDIVDRVFQEGAGFPKSAVPTTPVSSGVAGVKGVAEGLRRTALQRLGELINTHGDTDRILMDCFSAYPEQPFQDDTLLSKPNTAYKWLHFHDSLSKALYGSNEWELAPYLNTPVLAFHNLFASQLRKATMQHESAANEEATLLPFTGPQASWMAHEATKRNESQLQALQAGLCLELHRSFTSHQDIATDLLPFLLRMLSPNVNPVIVGGSKDRSTASVRKASEQLLVQRSVTAMNAGGVRFERTKVSASDADPAQAWNGQASWIYRMEPPIDNLVAFETGGKGFVESAGKTRYAVRQVLEQEWEREEKRRAEAARLARFNGGTSVDARPPAEATPDDDKKAAVVAETRKIKRDFFGRPIVVTEDSYSKSQKSDAIKNASGGGEDEGRVWITYHEGFSNAVRKPISLAELMKDL